MQKKVGALAYVECSSKTGEGVKEVFETAAWCAKQILIWLPDSSKERAKERTVRNRKPDVKSEVVIGGDCAGKTALIL